MTAVLIISLVAIVSAFTYWLGGDRAKEGLEADNYVIPKDDGLAEFAMSGTELAETYTKDQIEGAHDAVSGRTKKGEASALLVLLGQAVLIHEVRAAVAEKKEEPAA